MEKLKKGPTQMKNGKVAGEDNILPEMLKESDMKTRTSKTIQCQT